MTKEERYDYILTQRASGRTFADIGKELSITWQRVQQISTGKKNIQRASRVRLALCIGCSTEFKLGRNLKKYPVCTVCLNYYFRRSNGNFLQGMDYMRQIIRMRFHNQCQRCKMVWNKSMRRFDIHHLQGMCGKKSRSYDKLEDADNLTLLCHKCHMTQDEVKNKMANKLSPRPQRDKEYFVKNYDKIKKKQKEWRSRIKNNPQVSSN